MKIDPAQIEREYQKLRERLAATGWISQGYAQDRGAGAGGPCYQWTRKEGRKTVSVALSKEQYQALAQAIENGRQVETILNRIPMAGAQGRRGACHEGLPLRRNRDRTGDTPWMQGRNPCCQKSRRD